MNIYRHGQPGPRQFSAAALRAAMLALASLPAWGTGSAQTMRPESAEEPAVSNGEPETDHIVVTADRLGSFSADFVQAGTFRDSRLRDTPLTVSVMTRELLDAQQARSLIDAVRNTPGVTQSQINSVIYSNLSIRGIPVNNFANVRWNGILPVVNLVEQPIESKDRIEVLKGAAGLYYGFATPSGIVNLVTERPGEEPLTRFEVIGNHHGAIGANIDVGRRFGTAGVRLNAGSAILENGIRRSEGERHFVTGAFDWKPADNFELLLDAEYIYKTITEPTEFSLPIVNGVAVLPPLLAPSRNLGAEWMQAKGWQRNLLARANYDFASGWRISAAVGESFLSRARNYSSFGNFDPVTGNGTVTVAMTSGNDYRNTIYRGDLSGSFSTGPFEHNLLIGVSYNERTSRVPTAVRVSFAQNLFNPVAIPQQATPPSIVPNPSRVEDLGLYIFDRVTYDDWIQATIGYRKTDYSDVSLTSAYKIKPDTFSYGLMVKPVSWANLYGNYIEGLEPGAIAQQIAVNAGEILPAALSKQKEIGAKVEPLRGLLLTAAWFHIGRPSSYLNAQNYFVQDGRAVYEGVEFGATGELTPNLSIAASGIVLDATQKSGAAAVIGKRIENTARFSGSLFVEYRVPQIEGLRVSGGVFRVGRRAVNALNQGFVPGYTTFDLGMSYAFDLLGNRTIARIYGENIAGKRYWAATGSGLLQQGLPASVKFSLSTAF